MGSSRTVFLHKTVLLITLIVATLVFTSSTALAFGSIQFKRTTIEEEDGRWKFDLEINYGGKPHMGHIPFDFVFTQTNYFEFSQTDQDKEPKVRKKPLSNQTPQRESVDIDFADARGDLWPRTKFQLALRRDRGYSAGEYSLVIRRVSDGAQLGTTARLTLNGKNEFIDRRAIVFAGGDGKKSKPKEPAGETESASAQTAASSPPPASAQANEASEEDMEAAAPPPVEKRPGSHGCGCRLDGPSEGPAPSASLLLTLLLSVLVLARHRA